VILVVPGEEAAAEGPGILDAAEAPGELRLVFQRLGNCGWYFSRSARREPASFQMGWTAPTASLCQSAGCQNLQQGSRP
jgi:hypothetical protein